MKKIVLLLSISCASFGLMAQSSTVEPASTSGVEATEKSGPEMTFESKVVDYGTIEVGADGKRQFKFKNTGDKPLIIDNCRGSCGCTVPVCQKEPIMPGEEGEIEVKYDTNRVGPFTKTVTVTTNMSSGPIILKIKGKVEKK